MSSGFFGFFAHAGMLMALAERGLRPRRVMGSSAGALVASAYACGVEPERLAEVLLVLDKQEFWDPGPLGGLLQGGLLQGALFRRRLEGVLSTTSFEACRIPLAVSCFDVRRRETRVIAQGELASAVVASCSVPGLFRPVRRDGALLLDGGIRDRPGLAAALPGERILHHHLTSRSPWRRASELAPPSRRGLVALAIEGLPRAGPSRLDEGRRALALAHERTQRALDRPIEGGLVSVSAR